MKYLDESSKTIGFYFRVAQLASTKIA